MIIRSVSPVLNVSDVPASILWFESLGWRRSFTWNEGGMIENNALRSPDGPARFAGLCAQAAGHEEGPQIFLCLDGQGSRDPRPFSDPESDNYGGVWMSWWVDDVQAAHAECLRAGVQVARPPVNEPWGLREFLLRHPDGHYFRVSGPVQEADTTP
ncbi:MAG: VOC family protein [Phycisphaerales bacterium]